ncbi:MAG: hypothetical protein AVDCRST_MAG01-01-2467, partial [uncultured Rubrobacteraceae bacterium]
AGAGRRGDRRAVLRAPRGRVSARDHLERHRTRKSYRNACVRIFRL